MSQFKILAHRVAANVQIAVFHTKVVAAIANVLDGEGRGLAAVKQRELADFQFDFSRRHIRVFRFALDDGAFGLNHELAPEGAGLFEEFRVAAAIQEELGDAVTVAEVNPNEGAFVAGALHPAGQCHLLASVGKTKFATSMRSVHIL